MLLCFLLSSQSIQHNDYEFNQISSDYSFVTYLQNCHTCAQDRRMKWHENLFVLAKVMQDQIRIKPRHWLHINRGIMQERKSIYTQLGKNPIHNVTNSVKKDIPSWLPAQDKH